MNLKFNEGEDRFGNWFEIMLQGLSATPTGGDIRIAFAHGNSQADAKARAKADAANALNNIRMTVDRL